MVFLGTMDFMDSMEGGNGTEGFWVVLAEGVSLWTKRPGISESSGPKPDGFGYGLGLSPQ